MLPNICLGSGLIFVLVIVLACIFMRSAKLAQHEAYFQRYIGRQKDWPKDASRDTQRQYIRRKLSELLLEEGGLDALEAAERRGIFNKS